MSSHLVDEVLEAGRTKGLAPGRNQAQERHDDKVLGVESPVWNKLGW
jgi:hypothetical protein